MERSRGLAEATRAWPKIAGVEERALGQEAVRELRRREHNDYEVRLQRDNRMPG